MKKHLLLLCAMLSTMSTIAQTPLPVDTVPLIGHLENGLTYIIRHNEYPKDRANFYIAQRVGAVLEEDNQDGLAHFLEHMAFNGTKNFPDKGIIDCMERQGVKFGADINAYTSDDETVYNLDNVPTSDPAIVDSALLILHDWSGYISLLPEEIDKERGVIIEEWRTRNQANRRTAIKHRVNTLQNTPYAVRDIIGDTAVINNFEYDALRAYYKKWYRPDLQGIIVVGDIDVKVIEQKIKEFWSDIPKVEQPAERNYFPVTMNGSTPIVSIVTDDESTTARFDIGFRQNAVPFEYRGTQEVFVRDCVLGLLSSVIDMRFDDITTKASSPASGAGSYFTDETALCDAFYFAGIAKKDKLKETIQLVMDEMEKVRRWGVTVNELEVAKQQMLKAYEDSYNSRATKKNSEYVYGYVRAITAYEPITSIETSYNLANAIIPMINQEMVNQMAKQLLTENVVMKVSAATAEIGLPTQEELLQMFSGVKEKELGKYEEVSYDKPLVSETPAAGQIVSEKESVVGSTELLLSNNVKVLLLPTDYEDDQVLFYSYSPGGSSLLKPEESLVAGLTSSFIGEFGLGEFSASELTKVLAGKSISLSGNIGHYSEMLQGRCSTKDFETLLQAIYLSFGEPRRDEEAYTSVLDAIRTQLINKEKNPQAIFSDSVNAAVYGDNPYFNLLKTDDLEKISLDKILEIQRDRFSNAADFTFMFVGDFDKETVKPYIAQWLGSMKTTDKLEKPADHNLVAQKGMFDHEFRRSMTTDKVISWTLYSGELEGYDRKFNMTVDFLAELLDMRYLDTIREDEGGSYGVSTYSRSFTQIHYEYWLQMSFTTAPEKIERLYPIIEREIRLIAEQGPKMDDLKKVQDNKRKEYDEYIKRNGYWLNIISDYVETGIDKSKGYLELVDTISSDDIQAVAKKLLDNNNRIKVTMLPE